MVEINNIYFRFSFAFFTCFNFLNVSQKNYKKG